MIDAEKFQTMERVAEKLFRGGVFSADVKSADTAFAIILAGDEMGYEPMAAARAFALVKGKVSLSADAMIGLVKRSAQCEAWHVDVTTAETCTITTRRAGDEAPTSLTYTIAMAQRAGLTGSQTWRAHPEAMLRARCGAALARAVYPDVCGGLYEPDEAEEIRREGRSEPRDDAPPDRFAAFVADLAAADDLGAVRAVYDTYADALGGTHAKPITDAVVARLAACGYHLTAIEAKALIGGTLDAALGLAYDRLAAVGRHADDEDGHGVVADVVRVLRGCGALPKAAKTRLLKVAALTVAALLDVDVDIAAARLDAALRPPTPPTGTDAPRSTPTADATGSANDNTPTAGAQASVRTVLDADEVEARILRNDALGAATWAEHLAAHAGDQWALAIGFTKRVAAMKAAGVYDTRRKATLDAMERCPAFADRGHADLFLAGREKPRIKAPGAGEVIDLRNRDARANLAAQRTGTDG